MAKIFGFEIKRAQTAAAPTISPINNVSVQKNLQKTEPSRPLRQSFPRADLGDSGTRLLHGIITEEYNPQLQGIAGIKVFDEMRKNDGSVRAAMLATTLPIRRAKWFVNPSTEEQKDKDIANFVEHALFDFIEDMSWDDVIRQALLMIPFGVMLFEKIYGTKEHEGKTWVTIKKLAPRLPKSILMWELVDQTFGIQQIRQDGVLAQIPGSKLLIFVNEREGDNWWGTSMLRSAYKHWYHKTNLYQIQAIGYERQAVGVPMINMPEGYTVSDEQKAITAAQNLRSNEYGYLILPPKYTAEMMDMKAGGTLKPDAAIEHHNKQILQSVLAQFLELGATKSGSGSRALSQDHSDLFLKALEALANTIIAEFNKNLIPELVDMNFDNVTVYPKLDYSGIIKADMTALGTAYAQLVTAGALTPTDDDQQYIRAAMGLPPRTQEDIDEAANQDPSEEELIDHADIEDDGEPGPAGADNKKVDTASGKAEKPAPTTAQKKKTDSATKKKADDHKHVVLPRMFDDGKGFMSWRPLTFAEQKVTLKKIEDTLDTLQSDFSQKAKDLLNHAKDVFTAKLLVALQNGNSKDIRDLEINFVEDYKTLLKSAMKSAYEFGKRNAANEMGVAAPASSAESMSKISLLADTIANKAASDIQSKAKITVANAMKTETPALQTVGNIDAMLQDAIEKSIDNTSGILVAQSMNNGRNDVFQKNSDMIYALQRSEILDDVTCNFCLSMDGRTIEASDEWASTEIYHSNCRGIWVEILNDEANPPPIGGVPSNIADYYGGEPNALIQPPKPITMPGGLAEKEVQKRQDAKKK